jgi:hypothetical protein
MPHNARRSFALSFAPFLLTLSLADAAVDQPPDTSWVDLDQLSAGEVVVRAGKIDRGAVTIDVAVLIHASKETIWDILSECEIAPEYIPNVVACESIDSVNDGKSELFMQTVKPVFFVPRFEHVFRLDYFPYDRIDVHRVSGPIAEMEGSWWLQDYGNDSVILLHSLRLQPGIPIPRIFIRATLRRDLPIVLNAVRIRAEARGLD